MPDLQWQGNLLTKVNRKADALYERFYLSVLAETEDITDQEFSDTLGEELAISQLVTEDEIRSILRGVKPDKRPGADEIPNQIL